MSHYYYCTVAEVQATKGIPAGVTDSDIQTAIINASSVVNLVTSQYFAPTVESFIRDGGDPSLYADDSQRIISAGVVTLLDDLGAVEEIIEATKYAVKDRSIMWRRSKNSLGTVGGGGFRTVNGFPGNFASLQWDGTFGWIKKKIAASDVVNGVVAIGATSIIFTNSTLTNILVEGDLLTTPTGENFIVNSVDTGTQTVTIDAAVHAIADELTLTRYGAMETDIRRAAALITVSILIEEDTSGSAGGEAQIPSFEERLVSEKTDNYAYSLAPIVSGNAGSAERVLTGSSMAYAILTNYSAPVQAAWV